MVIDVSEFVVVVVEEKFEKIDAYIYNTSLLPHIYFIYFSASSSVLSILISLSYSHLWEHLKGHGKGWKSYNKYLVIDTMTVTKHERRYFVLS